MGWLSNAWGSIKHSVGSVTHSISHSVHSVGGKILHTLSQGAHTVAKGAKIVGGEVIKDTKGIVNFAGKQIDKVTTAESNLVGGLGGFLQNPFAPIALGIAGVGGILLLTRA